MTSLIKIASGTYHLVLAGTRAIYLTGNDKDSAPPQKIEALGRAAEGDGYTVRAVYIRACVQPRPSQVC